MHIALLVDANCSNLERTQGGLMAAQLKDKGHPALQTVRPERFGQIVEACQNAPAPTAMMLKLVANGKLRLQKN